MIDYLLQFTDEPTAQADPVVGAYYTTTNKGSAWRGDCCISNVQVWHPSQDTVTQIPGRNPGDPPIDVVTHQFLPGFYLGISKLVQDSALDNHRATELVLVRDSGPQYADFTGSISGRTLTVDSTVPITGVIAAGMILSGTGVRASTTIVSGSGLSWQIDLNQNTSKTQIHGQQSYIITTTYSAAEMQDLMIQPMYMGCDYPYQRTHGKWL